MQDRYTGDAGDFGKYGLLRALCGFRPQDKAPQLTLGILWYLTPDESHNKDGKHTRYLNGTKRNIDNYMACDPDLYRQLALIVHSNNRTVSAVRSSHVFPPDATTYFEDVLDYSQVKAATKSSLPQARLDHRLQWLAKAQAELQHRQGVFFDPDKSLEPRTTKADNPEGHRYAYIEDLKPFLHPQPRTLVIYHHTDRSAPLQHQVTAKLEQLKTALAVSPSASSLASPSASPFAMVYHRGSARAFIVVPDPANADLINKRAQDFAASNWSKHFDLQVA